MVLNINIQEIADFKDAIGKEKTLDSNISPGGVVQ
jgi:hypothetical protein